jgi:hypothetical protein
MGYTHYWYRPKTLNNFDHFQKDVKTLFLEIPKDIKIDWAGNSSVVNFNGHGDLSHETFYVPETIVAPPQDELFFDFCKTANKPYDLLVVASLIVLKYYCPECKISSDGDAEDWEEGLTFCRDVLKYGENPIK